MKGITQLSVSTSEPKLLRMCLGSVLDRLYEEKSLGETTLLLSIHQAAVMYIERWLLCAVAQTAVHRGRI